MLIQIITPEELETIICGKEVIDFHDLQANAHYEGYTADTPIIKYFFHNLGIYGRFFTN